jgi:hypothetical protein
VIRKLTKWKRRAMLAATMGLFLGAYSANSGKEQAHTKAGEIHFDIQKLGERIMAAHRALSSFHNVVHQKAEMQHVGQGDSRIHPLWVVEWEDCKGEYLCRTTWDAGNGKLLVAEHPVRRSDSPLAHDQGRRSAIRAAWGWMESLGAVRDAQRWRLNSAPLLKDVSWIVIWQAEGCRATVVMDRHTLDLTYLVVKEA